MCASMAASRSRSDASRSPCSHAWWPSSTASSGRPWSHARRAWIASRGPLTGRAGTAAASACAPRASPATANSSTARSRRRSASRPGGDRRCATVIASAAREVWPVSSRWRAQASRSSARSGSGPCAAAIRCRSAARPSSTAAAVRCSPARAPGPRSPYTAARISGWANATREEPGSIRRRRRQDQLVDSREHSVLAHTCHRDEQIELAVVAEHGGDRGDRPYGRRRGSQFRQDQLRERLRGGDRTVELARARSSGPR